MAPPSTAERLRFIALAAEARADARAGRCGPFGAVVVKDGALKAAACNRVVETQDPS